MDLEYMICFYSFELDWKKHDGLINSSGGNLLKTLNCISTPLNLGYGRVNGTFGSFGSGLGGKNNDKGMKVILQSPEIPLQICASVFLCR